MADQETSSATNGWGRRDSRLRTASRSPWGSGSGLLDSVHLPADHGCALHRERSRHRGPLAVCSQGRGARAWMDRGAVREAHPRRGVALRLRVGWARLRHGIGNRMALLRWSDRPDRRTRRLHRGFVHDTILVEFEAEPLPVWAWNVIGRRCSCHPVSRCAALHAVSTLPGVHLYGRAPGVQHLRDRQGGRWQ